MEYMYVYPGTGEDITSWEIEERFDEFLDENIEEVRIGTLTFSPSRVLKAVSPTDYGIALSEYLDAEIRDGNIEEVSAPVQLAEWEKELLSEHNRVQSEKGK